jgi:3-oxoadipate enol-lactonase
MLANINGISLYYDDGGKVGSPAILFLHGFPFSSEMWKGQKQMLQNMDLRVVTYDLRGHGQSGVGDGQYTIELFVDDLMALLDHLKISKTILCGFSMGGYIALRAIDRNPVRFEALVLCDTMSVADSNEAKLRRAASIKTVKNEGIKPFAEGFLKAVFSPQSFSVRPEIIDGIRKIVMSNSPTGICGALLAMAGRTDTSNALPKIAVPTMILVGALDAVTPPTAAQAMQEKIPGSELHVIPNAGHMSNLENHEEFNKHLSNFLSSVYSKKS